MPKIVATLVEILTTETYSLCFGLAVLLIFFQISIYMFVELKSFYDRCEISQEGKEMLAFLSQRRERLIAFFSGCLETLDDFQLVLLEMFFKFGYKIIIVGNQLYRCFKFGNRIIIAGVKIGKQAFSCSKFFFESGCKLYNVLTVTLQCFPGFVKVSLYICRVTANSVGGIITVLKICGYCLQTLTRDFILCTYLLVFWWRHSIILLTCLLSWSCKRISC